jgi:hypothetical protein
MASPKIFDPDLGESLSEEQNNRAFGLGIKGWKDALDEIERQRNFIQRWRISETAKSTAPAPLPKPLGTL